MAWMGQNADIKDGDSVNLCPQGVIGDKLKRKRFMRADELHKFSDGTLISVRDTLAQMLHELHLGYNKAMRRRQ
ncbi:hypothetical protein Tco_0337011 [Tanacetum coccineum]